MNHMDGLSGELQNWTNVSTLRPIWDCYKAIAEALLEMPVPTEE